METSGFYKLKNNELLFASQNVHAPDYTLLKAEKDNYAYPVEGWYWFASEEEARLYFGLPVIEDAEIIEDSLLAEKINQRKEELFNQSSEIVELIQRCNEKYANTDMPSGLVELIKMMPELRNYATAEIEALATVEDAEAYVVRGPQVENYIEQFNSYLQ